MYRPMQHYVLEQIARGYRSYRIYRHGNIVGYVHGLADAPRSGVQAGAWVCSTTMLPTKLVGKKYRRRSAAVRAFLNI